MNDIVNLAAYKFVRLNKLEELQAKVLGFCMSLDIKGTVLISPEGANIVVAGDRSAADKFISFIIEDERFSGMDFKESYSSYKPFKRMLVKVKREAIIFGVPEIQPDKKAAGYMTAHELKRWYDEEKDFVMLDARNDFEIKFGTFDRALPLGVERFNGCLEAIANLDEDLKNKPVVTFCTGGIRCEKAATYMQERGFKNVYQLEGGILKYFELVGGENYQGDCFVFDQRIALNPELKETGALQCESCFGPVSLEAQRSSDYKLGTSCPACVVV